MELTAELEEKLEATFMPYAAKQKQNLLAEHGRLVHYTTAENAIKIIRSKNLWMRNARGMSDFSEIEYGYNQLSVYFGDATRRNRFIAALDRCALNAGQDAVAQFGQRWQGIRYNTYVCCLSKHSNNEDDHGRLSMWRAFGRATAGIAMVLKPPEPHSALPLRVFLHPVAYFGQEEIRDEMDSVIDNIEGNYTALKDLSRDDLIAWVEAMFRMAVASLKHPGFREEQEWRLIHLPGLFPSCHMRASTEIVGGVPQLVHAIPLKNQPDAQISGIELPDLIDRIIIGPSQYAVPIYESLTKELTDAGVENAASKVVISGIPLRS